MLFKTVTVHTFIFLLLAFFVAPQPAGADGNKLLKACSAGIKVINKDKGLPSTEYVDSAFCAGLIQGVTDTNRMYRKAGKSPFFCMPGDVVNKGQAIRTVVNYLRAHPEKLESHETVLVIEALSEAFPCK